MAERRIRVDSKGLPRRQRTSLICEQNKEVGSVLVYFFSAESVEGVWTKEDIGTVVEESVLTT